MVLKGYDRTMTENKKFASIVSRYYKYDEAALVLDHVKANRNSITASDNINPQYSHKNIGVVTKGCKSPVDALEKACERYKKATGRKIRSDFNVLFDHVVVLSEAHYSYLEMTLGEEEAKKRVFANMIAYAKRIKREYGFEPISVQLHLCEGHEDLNGNFIRNIHGHVSLFNYDFNKKIAPLRHLMKKGKNNKGRTNSSNPHFENFQTIVAEEFSDLGFQRGLKKGVTGAKHMSKEKYVKNKIRSIEKLCAEKNELSLSLKARVKEQRLKIESLKTDIEHLSSEKSWLEHRLLALRSFMSEIEASLSKKYFATLNRFTDKFLPSNTVNLNIKNSPQKR